MSKRKSILKSETAVDWEQEPKLEGRVVGRGEEEMPTLGDPKKSEIRPFLKIATTDGRIKRVYENAALTELFAVAEDGMGIELEAFPKKKTKSDREFRPFEFDLFVVE